MKAALLVALLATPCSGQLRTSCSAEADAVAREVHMAIARYEDANAAALDGYRRISLDFPGMGEHWISLRHAVQDRFDPSSPPILLYARRGPSRVLVGAAFVALRDPGEEMPGPSALRHAWHVHNGRIDDEILAGDHEAAHDADAFAVMVLHVWTLPPLAGGAFDVQNWRLPWLREEIDPVTDRADAARALSLLSSAAYYRDALLRSAPAADSAALGNLIEAARTDVALSVAAADGDALARIWQRLAAHIVERWPDARTAVERLSHDPRVHLACAD